MEFSFFADGVRNMSVNECAEYFKESTRAEVNRLKQQQRTDVCHRSNMSSTVFTQTWLNTNREECSLCARSSAKSVFPLQASELLAGAKEPFVWNQRSAVINQWWGWWNSCLIYKMSFQTSDAELQTVQWIKRFVLNWDLAACDWSDWCGTCVVSLKPGSQPISDGRSSAPLLQPSASSAPLLTSSMSPTWRSMSSSRSFL